MKNIIYLSLTIGAATVFSHGQVAVANTTGTLASTFFVTDAGNELTTGIIRFGYYNSALPDFTTVSDFGELSSGFVQVGSDLAFNGSGFGFGDSAFFYNASQTNADPLPSDAAGKDAFLLIGNGADFGSSDGFIVYQNVSAFDNSGQQTTILLDENNASGVLLGDVTTFNGEEAVNFASLSSQIPEPTSAALLGLGGLALLGRRKRG